MGDVSAPIWHFLSENWTTRTNWTTLIIWVGLNWEHIVQASRWELGNILRAWSLIYPNNLRTRQQRKKCVDLELGCQHLRIYGKSGDTGTWAWKWHHLGRLWISWLRSWVTRPWSVAGRLSVRMPYKVCSSSGFAFLNRPQSIVSTPWGSFAMSVCGKWFPLLTSDWGICMRGRDFQYSVLTWFRSIAWITCQCSQKDKKFLMSYSEQ